MDATSPYSSTSANSSPKTTSLNHVFQQLQNISPPPLPLPLPLTSPTTPHLVLSPCAACKILRRRCGENCVLAPYFPPTEPLKFTTAHKVFGASNIIKMLQEVPEDKRADAVNSMVYEGNARIRDPVYGCAGAISQLQNQINGLQAELAKSNAQILNLQCQNQNLVSMICMTMSPQYQQQEQEQIMDTDFDHVFLEDVNLYDASWEPLWA